MEAKMKKPTPAHEIAMKMGAKKMPRDEQKRNMIVNSSHRAGFLDHEREIGSWMDGVYQTLVETGFKPIARTNDRLVINRNPQGAQAALRREGILCQRTGNVLHDFRGERE